MYHLRHMHRWGNNIKVEYEYVFYKKVDFINLGYVNLQ
jgi:hypothetical protein